MLSSLARASPAREKHRRALPLVRVENRTGLALELAPNETVGAVKAKLAQFAQSNLTNSLFVGTTITVTNDDPREMGRGDGNGFRVRSGSGASTP